MGLHPFSAGFAGRSHELRILDDLLEAAQLGRGSLVLVCGEPGIGKTTLCREAAERARRRGFRSAWGSCWPVGGAPPLWPWPFIMESLAGETSGQLFVDDPGGGGIDRERFARFAGVVGKLKTLSAARPAFVVVDDVHSADAGAILLIRFVARHLPGLRLVLLISARGAASDLPESLDVGSDVVLIPLGGLSLEDSADLLRVPGTAPLEDDALRVLVRLTGGHPLHLRRIMAAVSDPVGTVSASRGLREAINQAIDRLSLSARSVLSRCAVLGLESPLEECSAVAEQSPAAISSAVLEAVSIGLARLDQQDHVRLVYSHELVREAFEARLEQVDRVASHARAAAVLAPDPTVVGMMSSAARARLTRYAYHAVRAATRSPTDATLAVAACRSAAHAMEIGYAYEGAVSLLDNAVEVHERAGLRDPIAALLVERAEAVLMCGNLQEARLRFDQAVTAAQAEEDIVCLARASLGLCGVWVNEHRTVVEWDRVAGLLRQALAGLPHNEVVLRQRLRMRIAAEHSYRGGPMGPVMSGLADARELGDATALAEALSLAHHALLTAEHTWIRLPLAEELIAVAAPAGEGLLALFGLCWRAVDLFHLGDARAVRCWSELRERGDAVGCQTILHAAEAMGVMQLIRAGKFAEAERQAEVCYRLGIEVGDADAAGYLGAQLSTIRWCQGREVEMADAMVGLADSASLNPAEFGFQATAAHMLARAGQRDKARTLLAQLVNQGLEKLPDSSTWLAGMLGIVETARLLNDAEVSRQAYELLAPYAELPIMPSLAVTCLGSVHRPLGLAALTSGRMARARGHLEAAVEANRAYGNRPLTAITMAELAEAYLQGHNADDRTRATELISSAYAEASAMGMTGFARRWQRLLDGLREDSGVIEHFDNQWVLRLGDHRAQIADRVGVRYLSQLLTHPGRAIPAQELAAGSGGPTISPTQPLLDDRAKAEYRRRLAALAAEIASSEDERDNDRAELLRAERADLISELRRVTGLDGQSRAFADSGERARTSVRKALKRVIEEIKAVEPAIGNRILSTVTTGSTCAYTPDPDSPVRWRLADPDQGTG